MLHEAYDLFQVEVINQGKLYQRYADDFVYSHEFHDAIDAWSKNEHQKNYRIVDSLLSNRRDLVETYFNKEEIDDADLMVDKAEHAHPLHNGDYPPNLGWKQA